jgi:hypothetical protein
MDLQISAPADLLTIGSRIDTPTPTPELLQLLNFDSGPMVLLKRDNPGDASRV